MMEPTPEAIEAAGTLLDDLDADHISEVRPAQYETATTIIGAALDAFASRRVAEKDAEIVALTADRDRWMADNKRLGEALVNTNEGLGKLRVQEAEIAALRAQVEQYEAPQRRLRALIGDPTKGVHIGPAPPDHTIPSKGDAE